MGKMKWMCLALFQVMSYLCSVCFSCSQLNEHSGVISERSGRSYDRISRCWTIKVTEDSYMRIKFQEISFSSVNCDKMYIEVIIPATNESSTFCHSTLPSPILALSDVSIYYHHSGSDDWYRTSTFTLNYHKESLMCARPNHFRCSSHSCIHQDKVCNRVYDCENRADEEGCRKQVYAFEGVEDCQNNTVTWLKNQRSSSVGWGKNTHRAISALYLARVASFREEGNLEEELMAKQLELQAAVALLRNSTEPLSISELSMFINALTVTCHNPRRFYGFDLVKILGDRVSIYKKPCPGAYLTLCNLNWTFSESDVLKLLKLLENESEQPFLLEIQAMTVMALNCVKKKMADYFEEVTNASNMTSNIYNSTIERFIAGQLLDGSFGNIYTTALVTQALIASDQESNIDWKINSTAQYLIKQLNSTSVDFLSVYLTLPTFSSRSLANIAMTDCKNTSRKEDDNILKETEISDILEKLEKKTQIQYSLFVGDLKEVVHTIYLKVPVSSTVYDVMRMAQTIDPKYKFLHQDMSGRMYIYDIFGITNDPEEGKFWILYTAANKSIVLRTESPDKLILRDENHIVMWYKTAGV